MKTQAFDRPSGETPAATVKRRRVLAGAGLAGAAAVAAQALPGGSAPTAQTTAAATPPDTAAGYRLTPHIRRYYETTQA
jgi:hypothetical protein